MVKIRRDTLPTSPFITPRKKSSRQGKSCTQAKCFVCLLPLPCHSSKQNRQLNSNSNKHFNCTPCSKLLLSWSMRILVYVNFVTLNSISTLNLQLSKRCVNCVCVCLGCVVVLSVLCDCICLKGMCCVHVCPHLPLDLVHPLSECTL